MTSTSRYLNQLAIGLVLLTAAATGALANQQRGPIQASVDNSRVAAAAPMDTIVNASEDATRQGSRIGSPDSNGRYLYIVRFNEPSLARYEGGIEGISPTSARVTGERIDVNSDNARAYREFLASRHDDYLAQMGQNARRALTPTHQYLNVLNGVAVRMTPEEADLLTGLSFVKAVEIDRYDEIQTDEGPVLIGAPSFWDGDITGGVGNRGEGIVIGIIDSGFNHGHPSFAEVAEDAYVHTNPYGDGVFVGVCADPGADDYEDVCNNKLIGSYNLDDRSDTAEDNAASGHGTHVASTAGGNPLSGLEIPFNYQTLEVDITGVAPRANLINYKVCEPDCSAAARIAAIEFAIGDGVSVLNHSIGNGEPPWASSVSLAFLDANAAGIFVAASAGNSGPGPSTVASTGPWNTAVAASTHQRRLALELDVTGGDAGIPVATTSGPALAGPIDASLVYAGDIQADNFEACAPFAAGVFTGNGVLVRRGGCSFADKVNNAADAGADFVFIANNIPGLFGAGGLEATTIPSIAVDQSTGDDLITAIGGTSVGVDVVSIIEFDPANADIMGDFSSRGPASYNNIAPAVTAPGVQILAASTTANDNFNIIGGTSMSSPHVAGSAALLIAQNPDWTPTEVRSALALSANPNTLKEDGVTPSDAFDHGSGRIQVADAGSIGFVMDESIANFEAADPTLGGEPADLNMPSIMDSTCPDTCTFERTIRSVVDDTISYTVSTDVPPGVVITVSPSAFLLNPDSEQVLSIEIDVTGATQDEWLFADIQLNASEPETASYADTNVGGPTFERPFTIGDGTSGSCSLSSSGSAAQYHTQDIEVGAAGSYRIESDQDYDGYLHVYEDSFIPADPCVNLIALNDDAGAGSLIESVTLSDAVTYTVVTSGFGNSDAGNFTNTITGPGAISLIGAPPPRGGPPFDISTAHLPVAVIAVEPKPTIELSAGSLSSTQQRDQVTSQQFSISNQGELPLEWSLNELGPQGRGSASEGFGVIWNNPQAGTSGRINNFSIPDATGIYQSDAFAILTPSSVETISTGGFLLGSPGVTDLAWMVFPDNNGVPAGDPETSPENAIWSFQAAADAVGVTFDDGDMSLDLVEAGAPPLDLTPGVYWLVAYPTVQTYSLGPNNLHAWFHGESVATGRQIAPGALSGFPTDWAGAPEGRAFTLAGTISCDSQFNPWTNVTPTSGMLDPGESEDVNVDFFSTGLQEGTYNTSFCILSNDPEQGATLLPVELNVVNLPSADITPDSESLSFEFGASGSAQVVISNSGLGELEFNVVGGGAPSRGGSTLIYDQTASQTTGGVLGIYDLDGPETWAVQAADDFTVPPGEAWVIDQVLANGFYLQGPVAPAVVPTSDVRVFFYEDDNGQPGAEIANFDDLVPSSDVDGAITIDLPSSVALNSGTFWVSVQPEMDFANTGLWYWFLNSDQIGSEFHWRNPGGGYTTPEDCTDWNTSENCGYDNPDVSFQLFGAVQDGCDAVDSVAWLSVDPASGTVAAEGGEQPVDLLVDASQALPGNYEATVCFETNDGENPILVVDVALEVTGEAPDGIFQDRFEGEEEL